MVEKVEYGGDSAAAESAALNQVASAMKEDRWLIVACSVSRDNRVVVRETTHNYPNVDIEKTITMLGNLIRLPKLAVTIPEPLPVANLEGLNLGLPSSDQYIGSTD